jgi:hypothetical protein
MKPTTEPVPYRDREGEIKYGSYWSDASYPLGRYGGRDGRYRDPVWLVIDNQQTVKAAFPSRRGRGAKSKPEEYFSLLVEVDAA